MTQSNVIAREHRTLIGMETTFGTTPAGSYPEVMTEIVPIHDALHIDGLAVEMLDVNDARVRRNDATQPVQGLKMASKVAMTCYAKAVATTNILTAAGTVGSLSQCLPFLHCFGVEHAAIGTTVSTAASETTFDATSVATLKKGTWITVTISGTPEPCKITNISTNTVTVEPALSATPANGAIVRNLRTYAPAESHSSSMTCQFAFAGDSAAQYTANGVCASMKITTGFGQLVTYALDGMAATFTGPSAQAIAVTSVTDDMSAPFLFKEATVLLAASPARATGLVCETLEVDFPNDWKPVRDPNGTETINSMVNVAGRPRAATLKIRLRFDSAQETAFTAETGYSFYAWVPYGSGTTTRYLVLDMSNVKIVNKPKPVKVDERFYLDLELGALKDDTVTVAAESGTDLDLIYAPYRVAFG